MREDRRDDDGRLFVPWWLMLKSALRLIEKDRVGKREKKVDYYEGRCVGRRREGEMT